MRRPLATLAACAEEGKRHRERKKKRVIGQEGGETTRSPKNVISFSSRWKT